MGLTAALQSARSGLFAAQAETGLAADNIANALTPGYVRREAARSSEVFGGFAGGVASNIGRASTDAFLLREFRFSQSLLAGASRQADAAAQIAAASGALEDDANLASAIARLETAFQTLSDDPGVAANQRSVLEAAKDLETFFAGLEEAVRGARERADADIATSVETVNDALERLDVLNAEIGAARNAGRDASSLEDEQDRLLDTISAEIGIRSYARDDGELVVTTKEGVTLLDGGARSLAFTPTGAIPPGLTLGGGLSGLTLDGVDITPGGGAPQAAGSGALAGLFSVRDGTGPAYQAQIDELARQVIDTFQTADASVVAAGPGATGLFTDAGAFHDAGAPADPVPGLAGRFAVNAAVDPSQGGQLRRLRDGVQAAAAGAPSDPTQVNAFLDALSADRAFSATPGLSTATTLRGYATELVAGQQTDRVRFENEAEAEAAVAASLESRRINADGVNVDAESQRLIELEQAYAANAQVIEAVARMLDELIASVR